MKVEQHLNPNTGGTYWLFHCPGCESTHAYYDKIERGNGGPGWQFNGDFEKPTFTPSLMNWTNNRQSVCHLFMRDGKLEFLSDCTHKLSGQTVDVPDFD
jgi:hypothetical protein